MKPKEDWIEEVLLDLRVVLESKEFTKKSVKDKLCNILCIFSPFFSIFTIISFSLSLTYSFTHQSLLSLSYY